MVAFPSMVLLTLHLLGHGDHVVERSLDGIDRIAQNVRLISEEPVNPPLVTLPIVMVSRFLAVSGDHRSGVASARDGIGPITIGAFGATVAGDEFRTEEAQALVRDRLGRCAIESPSNVPSEFELGRDREESSFR